jgi:lysozyme
MSDPFLEQRIIEHEGIKKSIYKDSLGFWSIGIGFLVDPSKNAGLSVEECMMILRSRISNLEKRLSQYNWYTVQDVIRKGVLLELSYNLGVAGLLDFKEFLALMAARRCSEAALDLKGTKWASQVSPARVNDILMRLREGTYNIRT